MTNPHLAYRPDIDGIRAVAILSVLGFHAFPQALPGGFVGVDVFFVISGYLISGILIKALSSNTFSFREFYGRRIRRIFPALAVVLTTCLLFGRYALRPDELAELGKHTASGAGFVANIVYWNDTGYFDSAAEVKPLLHLWSLGIEEQFYIVWPVVLWLTWRWGANPITLMTGLGILSFALNVRFVDSHQAAAFYLPVTRAWELLAGSLLAWIQVNSRCHFDRWLAKLVFAPEKRTSQDVPAILANLQATVGLALIGVAVFMLQKGFRFPGWNALLPVVGTVLLISGGPTAWTNRNILASRPMILIGLISFPLYLWHWPLLSFARIMEERIPSTGIRLGAVGLSFVLAYLTWRWIEGTLRTSQRRTVTAGLVVAMVAIGGAGYYAMHKPDQFVSAQVHSRLSNEELFRWDQSFILSDRCLQLHPVWGVDYCVTTEVGGAPPHIALIGDSHANSLYPGIARHFQSRKEGVVHLGKGGCPPLLDVDAGPIGEWRGCPKVVNGVINYVADNQDIQTVILASLGPPHVLGTFAQREDGRNADTRLKLSIAQDDLPQSEIYAQGLRKTIARLTSAGKTVVLAIDIPELTFNPRTCLDTRPLRLNRAAGRDPCSIPRALYEERSDEYRRLTTQIAHEFPAVRIWDTIDQLCDDHVCWARRDGELLYRDDNHLSLRGSLWLGDRFPQPATSNQGK